MKAAVQEALFLKQPLEEFVIQQQHSKSMGEENQNRIKLGQNPVMQNRSKHIETNFYFNREKTKDGTISIH